MHWYVAKNDQTLGPLEQDAMIRDARAGIVSKDTLVWREGLAGWVAAGSQPELWPATPPPPPPNGANVARGKRSTIIGWLIGLGSLLIIVLAKSIGWYVGHSTVQNYQHGEMEGALTEAQSRAATELRKQLPQKIDEVTTLNSIFSTGTTLQYGYSISYNLSELNVEQFKQTMTKALQHNVCGIDSMVKTMKIGGKYSYLYMDKEGQLITKIDIDSSSCETTGAP